jgi:hypothetical protein
MWLPGMRRVPTTTDIKAIVRYRLYGFELRQQARRAKRQRRQRRRELKDRG